MTYNHDIMRLCEKYTDLSEKDIHLITVHAERLMRSTAYQNEDVFIDVWDVFSKEAMVVFHKRPQRSNSLYKNNVIGEYAYQKNEPGVIRTFRTGVPSVGLSATSQEGLSIQQNVYPIKNGDKEVIAVIIIETDITDTLKTNFSVDKEVGALTTTLQSLSEPAVSITDYIDDLVLIFDYQGILQQKNTAADNYYKSFGYMDDIAGMHYDNLALDSFSFRQIKQLTDAQQWDAYANVEVNYGQYYFSIKRIWVQDGHNFVMICKDVTEMKQKESKLISEATAVREIHHRVKNNLQTVVSLLRLQARRTTNKEVRDNLDISVNRVLSIAMTHELLSKQTDDVIVLANVLEAALENLKRFFGGHLSITLSYHINSNVMIDSNRAVALVLIVNELIQNSYDHAFTSVERLNPYIHLQVLKEDDLIRLEVVDNGGGYDTKKSYRAHLGLEIVNSFVESKLHGKISVYSDSNGTVTTVTFKY